MHETSQINILLLFKQVDLKIQTKEDFKYCFKFFNKALKVNKSKIELTNISN